MAAKIVWLPRARAQRTAAIDYVAAANPLAAVHMLDEIERQVGQLAEHPGIGRPGRVDRTRELVISRSPYILIYRHRPRADRVEILTLLHSSQLWPPKA